MEAIRWPYKIVKGREEDQMTKVDIISGFLGAGKTTFIKQLIDQVFTGEKLVLIENEFGEIGIDGGFLKDAGIEITEMNSGCICCTLVGDFSKALQKVLEEYEPDRVLIEPSGVGKLSDIVKAIEDVKKEAEIEIHGRITVVDGKKAALYLKNFGEFFEDQVKHASTIVISRTQMMTDEKLEECVHMLRGVNPEASIISTPWEELDREAVCRALEHGVEIEELLENHSGHGCGHHHEHGEGGEGHHHDHEDECRCSHGHEDECGHHHHHKHGEECGCCQEHEDECGHHHHHEYGEECGCGHEHHHEHGEECGCGHEHHHEHEEECGCRHEHHHEHGEECGCCQEHEDECGHHHHHGHGEECGHARHHTHEDDGHCCGHGHHGHHHHHADEIFTSWGKETAHKYTDEELDFLLKALSETEGYGMILRSKGIIPMADGTWKQFDLVPEEYEVREGKADYTGRICVIGTDLKEEELLKLFHI